MHVAHEEGAIFCGCLSRSRKCIANPKCYDSLNRQHIVLEILAPHKHLLSCGVLSDRTSADVIPMRTCFELAGNNYFHFQLSEHDTPSGMIVRRPSRPPSLFPEHFRVFHRTQPRDYLDSRTSVSPGPGGCHDIERSSLTETAQHLRLAKQDGSTSDSIRPYSASSCPSSELLHNALMQKTTP
jgi:hypothetical protein